MRLRLRNPCSPRSQIVRHFTAHLTYALIDERVEEQLRVRFDPRTRPTVRVPRTTAYHMLPMEIGEFRSRENWWSWGVTPATSNRHPRCWSTAKIGLLGSGISVRLTTFGGIRASAKTHASTLVRFPSR